MKNILKILVFSIFFIGILAGCGVSNKAVKTEYKVNEVATIDQYRILCKGYEIINQYQDQMGKFLKIDYKITNLRDQSYYLDLQNDFQLQVDSGKYIPAITSDHIEIKGNEEKTLEIVYDLKEYESMESYKVIFYSGVVSNNIAFVIQ